MVKVSSFLLFGASASVQACTAPKSNSATVDLVAEFEGFRASVYRDAVGLQTVGYGHLCKKPDCAEVPYPIPLTKEDGKKLLASDMGIAENCIYSATTDNVKLNANQYGALVSWAFNVGCGNVRSSNLIERLNKGEDPDTVAASELPHWNRAGGKPISGLTRRRKAEVVLFTTSTDESALPACVSTPTPTSTTKAAETSITETSTTEEASTSTPPQQTTTQVPTVTPSAATTLSTVKNNSTSAWGNSTTAAPTSTLGWTTSVVYTTEIHTVTHCASTVTNCPARPHITTKTIPLYTTICPITETEVPTLSTVVPTETVVPVPSVPTGPGSLPSNTDTWTAPSQTCNGNCTLPAPTSPPPVSSGAKTGVSVVVMIGAITALLL